MPFYICLFIICGSTAFVGAVPTWIYGHDDFFLLDNGWRTVCGQRPHLDFFSPWGPVMFLVVGFGLVLSNASVDGIGYANAIVGLIVGLWAFWLSRGRLAPAPRFILGIYLALLLTAPYSLGIWPLFSSHAMLYNRYGYVLLGLLLIECFLEKGREEEDRVAMLGGISTGIVVAIALFLKASYFAIALPLIIFSFLFRRPDLKRVLGMGFGFCVVFSAMLAYLRFDLLGVFEGLSMAAGARSQALSLPVLARKLMSQLPALLTVAAILFFEPRRVKPTGSWLDNHKWFFLVILVFVSDSLLMISNEQRHAMPLLGVFAILFASHVVENSQRSPMVKELTGLSYHLIVLALCALLVVPQLASDFGGLANGVYQKTRVRTTNGLVQFTEPHMASLRLYDRAGLDSANGILYTNYVNDGAALLRQHCNANDRVLTMDMANPFPYAMQWKPPQGGIALICFNYTVSEKYRPSFDAYFGDATVVLLPKHPAQYPKFISRFYALYVPALHERYRLYTESDWFWLFKRP